ncbi:MAG: CCA tRNA nucleotidyltransferase [Parcubacteria group bacterium]
MKIPKEVKEITKKITDAGFEAYIVGGCVRDILMDLDPKDWDVTTNATPEQIQEIFPDSFYENEFGTVGVKTDNDDPVLHVVEVTTYRLESAYSDKRRPDSVTFTKKLDEDLKRRDFTMNAIAMDQNGDIADPYKGQEDIKKKVIRAVGDPDERFAEDALRMMRAIRFVSMLGFEIESETLKSIKKHHESLKDISQERIHDELIKLINGQYPDKAIELLRETGLMKYVLPELLEGVGVEQNLHHIYTVWEHNILSLKYSAEQKYSIEVRIASLLHDVGKPKTKYGEGYNSTFYSHEVAGERMTRKALERLKFSKDMTDKIAKLVRWHMFYYDVEKVTESAVRRLVVRIGRENVEDLIKVREADRIGSGVPKAKPYKLRHLQFMIDKVARDPVSPKMLKINGNDLMKLLKIEPSPKIGMIVHALMEEVLDDPKKNTKKCLSDKAKELNDMSEAQLMELKKKGQDKIAEEEEREVGKIKAKHYVK